MNKILTEFEILDCDWSPNDDGTVNAKYNLYKGTKIEERVCVTIAPKRKNLSRVVVEESENYVNGFKVIRFQTGEFGYRRESDGEIMPFYYDVAGNFNEYGFAMVGRNTFVTWIDKTFRLLDNSDNWIAPSQNENINSFVRISSFSAGETPLSILRAKNGDLSFLNTQGKKQVFTRYNGELQEYKISGFRYVDTLDHRDAMIADDILLADGKVLFARGFYCEFSDIIKLNLENGYLSKIAEQASKHFTIQPVNPDNKES